MRVMNLVVIRFFIFVIFILSTSITAQEEIAVYDIENLIETNFMHSFLLVGPFPNPLPDGETEYYHTKDCKGFYTDYFESVGGETKVLPGVNESIHYEKDKFCTWKYYSSKKNKIDLREIFQPESGAVAYAACWLISDCEQEKIFGLGTNDGVKVWLNGKQIHELHMPRTAETDDDYLRLNLQKGKNLLLIKVDQGGGAWEFKLRPVNEKIAWLHIQENLDREIVFDLRKKNGFISGTIGDKNSVGALRKLPQVKLKFQSLHSKHQKSITAQLGSKIMLPSNDFPGEEYSIHATVPVDTGIYQAVGYVCTSDDIIHKTQLLLHEELPKMPYSVQANYYHDFVKTVKWMDRANKFLDHPYGYRRYLNGLQSIHKKAKNLSEKRNPFDGLFPAPKKIIHKKQKAKITSKWKINDLQIENDFITAEIARVWYKTFKQTSEYADRKIKNKIIKLSISNSPEIPANEGGYLLKINPDRIDIVARTRQGLFYGTNTFLQLLQQTCEIPCAEILDFPTFSYRGTYEPTSKLTTEYKEMVDQLARLRYNMIYIYSSNFLYLENSQKLSAMQEVFEYCKSRFMEPIPLIETFGGWTITRVLDPCLDEGIYHENEKWSVPEDGLLKLKVPRIHDCPNTRLHIFLESGKELIRNRDYQLVSTEPPEIQFINTKLKNKKLLLNYDAVDFSLFKFPASCPSDPKSWKIQDRVIGNIIQNFKPKYFHISQDEAGFVNTCSRCKARGLSNKEIMIDELNKVYQIVRKYSKDVEIHMWGDLFNDYQNAKLIKAEGCAEGIPKDIVQFDWNYAAVYHYNKRQTFKQMKHFFDLGLKVGGVSWWEPANVLDILTSGEKYPSQFLGIMHTSWTGYRGGLMPTAEVNWTGNTVLGRLDF